MMATPILGGDNLNGNTDKLPVATMMATPILGGDDLDGDVDELPAATMMASLSLSLSRFSVCKMWFERKTTNEMVLQVRRGILRSKCKTFSVGAKHTQGCKILS